MKKLLLLVMVMLISISTMACTKEVKIVNNGTVEEIKKKKSNVPTVFLHGYNGSNKTMKSMMDQLEIEGISKEEMVMRISNEGELEIESHPEKGFEENNPTIRLIFEDSKSHQWNQAVWLKTALTYLKSNYQVEEVNLVGFSMGGISSFLYLETFSGEKTQPKIKKTAAIGAPFNEFIENPIQSTKDILANGPSEVGEQLINYRELSDNIPESTTFLLIAGELSEIDKSDGTVPISSALGVYSLLKDQGNEVEYKVISGNQGKHGELKSNPDVSQLILSFLWE